MTNLKFRDDIFAVAREVEEGHTISSGLNNPDRQEFPKMITKMVAVGEKGGNIDEMLLYLAEFYEEEIESVSKNLTTLLEPILLLIIGLIVGFMAIAIISPIYQLTGSVGNSGGL